MNDTQAAAPIMERISKIVRVMTSVTIAATAGALMYLAVEWFSGRDVELTPPRWLAMTAAVIVTLGLLWFFDWFSRNYGQKQHTIMRTALLAGLSFVSWIATYRGVLELIEANAGQVDQITAVSLGFAVFLLMGMIIYVLNRMFTRPPLLILIFLALMYILLELISIGFGFGFFWKNFNSSQFAVTNTNQAIAQIQGSLQAVENSLGNVITTMEGVSKRSEELAEIEASEGGTCDDQGGSGRGPRMRKREADQRFAVDTATNVERAVANVRLLLQEVEERTGAFVAVRDDNSLSNEERNRETEEFDRELRALKIEIDSLLGGGAFGRTATAVRERAQIDFFVRSNGTQEPCPDPTLKSSLLEAANILDSIPTSIVLPEIRAARGSEATKLAFERLAFTSLGLITYWFESEEDQIDPQTPSGRRQAINLGEQQAAQVDLVSQPEESVNLLEASDAIPLLIAVFVDFCIALISFDQRVLHFRRLNELIASETSEHHRLFAQFMDAVSGGEPGASQKAWSIFTSTMLSLFGSIYLAIPRSRDPYVEQLHAFFMILEDMRIVTNVSGIPFLQSMVRRSFKARGSIYAQFRSFDIYRFPRGSLAQLVVNRIMEQQTASPDENGTESSEGGSKPGSDD